ncbi:MAG: stage V sporulation protein AD [Firmicutes bacterium]|nr:stage V sporulation protein AD [Bacillota bacterium]
MTFKYHQVFVEDASTVAGPYEAKGPLKKHFDKTFENLYHGEKSWETAEAKILEESIRILLNKTKKSKEDIDVIISGDLMNQITSSCYSSEKFHFPFLGIYSACAISIEGMILGSTMIDAGKVSNVIASTSSHNMSSEKQFRNPTEYGAPKPKTATFTATGGASILLTNENTGIKVESSTIGRIIDYEQTDPFHMGAVMAPAAADTIYRHLTDLSREPEYYDLILTGDLGLYGKEILIDFMKTEYGLDIKDNYNDCGVMLYDLETQKEVLAGGSGPVCSALVNYSVILEMLKKKKIKKVLLVATGALFSPTMVYQHKNILSIAHAISLEVIQ